MWLAEFKRKFIQNHPRAYVINNVVGFFGKVEPIDVLKSRYAEATAFCFATTASPTFSTTTIYTNSKQKQRRRSCLEARGGGEERRHRQQNGGANRKKCMNLCFAIEHFCDGSIPHHMTVKNRI
jgi:hypothetical protein